MEDEVKFICPKCKHSKPVQDESGEYREWQFCCDDAMQMGVVIGRLVLKGESDNE